MEATRILNQLVSREAKVPGMVCMPGMFRRVSLGFDIYLSVHHRLLLSYTSRACHNWQDQSWIEDMLCFVLWKTGRMLSLEWDGLCTHVVPPPISNLNRQHVRLPCLWREKRSSDGLSIVMGGGDGLDSGYTSIFTAS